MIEETIDGLMSHTVNIKLLSGKELFFSITTAELKEIKNWLRRFLELEDIGKKDMQFFSFIAFPSRVVFVRKSAIKSILLLTDQASELVYRDNHDRLDKDIKNEEEVFIDDAIFKMIGCEDPNYFCDLAGMEFPFLTEDLDDKNFVKRGFIELPDDDGDIHFIPISNIEYMELDRSLVYDDELWKVICMRDEINLN